MTKLGTGSCVGTTNSHRYTSCSYGISSSSLSDKIWVWFTIFQCQLSHCIFPTLMLFFSLCLLSLQLLFTCSLKPHLITPLTQTKKIKRNLDPLVPSFTWLIWITCVGLLMSTQECMSVSRYKNTCQRHMTFVHHTCYCKPKTIPDTKYWYICATNRHRSRCLWWDWIIKE